MSFKDDPKLRAEWLQKEARLSDLNVKAIIGGGLTDDERKEWEALSLWREGVVALAFKNAGKQA